MSIATRERGTSNVPKPLPELRIYGHSHLLFWRPVWAVAFLMALWTYLDDYHMVLVPEGSVVEASRVIAPEGQELASPFVHVARSKWPGVLFALTLLAIVIFSHAWLRGPWALFVSASCVALLLLISWADWWEPLFRWFRMLRIYINLGGYLVIGTTLLVAWLVALFIFDRRTYLIFSVGQVRTRDELGDEEKVFDTSHVAFEKRQYDWFRWLVGFGSGDMVLRIGGPSPQSIELRNVVRVGKRLHRVEERLRTKDVV